MFRNILFALVGALAADLALAGCMNNLIEVSHNGKYTAEQKVKAVRSALECAGVDAFIVKNGDAHNSLQISPAYERREWLTGLTGPSGSVVVTQKEALVWADSRQWDQFDRQVDTKVFKLMKQGFKYKSMITWLEDDMPKGSKVGADPTTYSQKDWQMLKDVLASKQKTLKAVSENLVDAARAILGKQGRVRPNKPLIPLPLSSTGKTSGEKLAGIRKRMSKRNVSVLVLSLLDDIAWTLNIRGSDIPYFPVFYSYLVIQKDANLPNSTILFWADGNLAPDVQRHLKSEGVTLTARPYHKTFESVAYITKHLSPGSTVWLSEDANEALYSAAVNGTGAIIYSASSPVQMEKMIKNEVELRGIKAAHVKDGIAVVRTLNWLQRQVNDGANVTELDVAKKLEEMRLQEVNYQGPSFHPIVAAGANAASIHYCPSKDGPQHVIKKDDLVVIDSGGHYMDGTTDVTRTWVMNGEPSVKQRLMLTRVLKAQIQLATTVFPSGTPGWTIDVLARKTLWDVGLDFEHTTGHGVGHFLGVHEGTYGSVLGLAAGMVFGNEPGYYEKDTFGIRNEDVMEVVAVHKTSNHSRASEIMGDFHGLGALGFNTLSLVPYQTNVLNNDLLTDLEVDYLAKYQERVLDILGPILKARGLTDDLEWLQDQCENIVHGYNTVISVAGNRGHDTYHCKYRSGTGKIDYK